MTAFAIHVDDERGGAARWSLSAILIVALHAALIAILVMWARTSAPPGASLPTISIDMSPVSTSPEPQQMDIASGPQMQEADAPAEPPPQQIVQPPPEQIASTPVQEKPEVQAAPEQRPPAAKPTPEPLKPQAKPKPVEKQVKKSERPPAPRTSAAPSAERRAPQASAMAGAAAAAALPSYRQILAAHLQRFKQYPAAAKSAGITGTSMLSFRVARSGGVMDARLAGSSGHAALDAETMAMIRRAQPLPAFPSAMTQTSLSFTVPVRFSIGN